MKNMLQNIGLVFALGGVMSAQAGWQFAYEHDAQGQPIAGDIAVLTDAVANGADVKVEAPSSAGTASFFGCDFVFVKEGLVTCMNTRHISVRGIEGSDFGFQDNAYHWFLMVNTNGKRDMSRWNVGEHVDRGHTQNRVGLRWYVD